MGNSGPRPPDGLFTALIEKREGAAHAFVTGYWSWGHHLARRFGLTHHDAEDAVQAAMIHLLKYAKGKPDVRNEGALVAVSIRHACIDVLNARDRAPAITTDDIDVADGRIVDPADRASEVDELNRVRAGLARLRSVYCEAIELITLAELTYEEAAAQLGIPVGTMKSRHFRAIGQLRQFLAHSELYFPRLCKF